MPSWLRTCFTLAALLLVLIIVGAAVLGVIERHLEEHRHHGTTATLGIKAVQGAEDNAWREARQGAGHGAMVTLGEEVAHEA